MAIPNRGLWILILFVFCLSEPAIGRINRLRCMWRDDPATSMVIAWDQRSGTEPALLYDTEDFGQVARSYRMRQRPDRSTNAKGMNTQFVRLTGLKPNTVYYFVILDSEGLSKRFSFRTAPNTPDVRLSVIAGGDSRNHREARVDANKIVSKIRPNFIMFGGDMTENDSPKEWQDWLDDWQYTIGSDGRLFPIITARGNHESQNASITELFDSPSPDVYFALTIGGNLLRVYTLNSLIPPSGNKRDWLQRDLAASQQFTWRFAQYHHAIRPHTLNKNEKDELLINWATLFHKYKVHVAVESDAHVVKWTWPIRPSKEPGSDQGFIRDDENGTVYLGEGTWGAPLRVNNDDKNWTRASGSFNQFKWLFVDQRSVEIRTIRTDGADRVQEIDPNTPFEPPLGLVFWNPPTGDVVTIKNKNWRPTPGPDSPVANTDPGVDLTGIVALVRDKDVVLSWTVNRDKTGMTYEILRSTDGGTKFSPLARASCKGEGKQQYEFPDRGFGASGLLAKTIYRVKCIYPDGDNSFHDARPEAAEPPPAELPPISRLTADDKGMVNIDFTLGEASDVDIILLTEDLREVARLPFPREPKGDVSKTINLSRAPAGKYILVVKAAGEVIRRYAFNK